MLLFYNIEPYQTVAQVFPKSVINYGSPCVSPRILMVAQTVFLKGLAMTYDVQIPSYLAKIATKSDFLQTDEFASVMRRADQTIRKAYCLTGHYLGIRPVKIGNRLLWRIKDIAELLEGGAK